MTLSLTPKRKQKLFVILGLVALASVAVGLTLYALRANINLFFSPVQIAAGEAPLERQIRAGGMVKEGTVVRNPDSLEVEFTVTDYVDDLRVHYSGILPDLFREGQGVVVVAQALVDAGYKPEDFQQKAEEAAKRAEANASNGDGAPSSSY